MAQDIPVVLADEVAELLVGLARHTREVARRDLDPLGVTWAQVRALRAVARGDGPMRMSHVADRLGIARRSATSVVDELERRGLVERRSDPADRRAVTVQVTEKGRELLADLDRRRHAAAGAMAAALSDEDLRTLRDLLRRLAPDEGEE
jgi:DNA-binding MarR family transcriptional regulator